MATERDIIEVVIQEFGITEEQLKTESRNRRRADARRIVLYLLLQEGVYPSVAQARYAVNLQLDSAYKTLRKMEHTKASNPDFREALTRIKTRLAQR